MIPQTITSHSMTPRTIRKELKNTCRIPISTSGAENRPPDAHHRRAFLDRDLEILAHPHRQMPESGLIAELAKPPEMLPRISDRRDGHQPDQIDPINCTNLLHDIMYCFCADPPLLRLLPRLYPQPPLPPPVGGPPAFFPLFHRLHRLPPIPK